MQRSEKYRLISTNDETQTINKQGNYPIKKPNNNMHKTVIFYIIR